MALGRHDSQQRKPRCREILGPSSRGIMSSGNDWNKRNRDKATAATRRWRERNPGWQQRERETAWKRLYGLAPADFYALKREQGAQCAICEDENGGKELDVDHDHATGRVRGLLCRRCNGMWYVHRTIAEWLRVGM